MDTEQLWRAGNNLIDGFVGVFPLDRVPLVSNLIWGNSFIVKTETRNLPGQHWIAVYVGDATIHVFDPLGVYYPVHLVSYLQNGHRRVIYSRTPVQDPRLDTCGQHCLRWIIAVSSYLYFCLFVNYIFFLLPIEMQWASKN